MHTDDGNMDEGSSSPDAAPEFWRTLDDDDIFEARRKFQAVGYPPHIKLEANDQNALARPQQPQYYQPVANDGPWFDPHAGYYYSERSPYTFDTAVFPTEFVNYVPVQSGYSCMTPMPYPQTPQDREFAPMEAPPDDEADLQDEAPESYTHKMRVPSGPMRIVSPAVTIPRTKMRKKRKISKSTAFDNADLEAANDSRQDSVETERPAVAGREVENLLKQLGRGEVTLHVYENAQRLYIRYINENGIWQMRDVADFLNVKFHTDNPDGPLPVPLPFAGSAQSLLPAVPQEVDEEGMPFVCAPVEEGINYARPCAITPAVKDLSRDLVLEFKRKEHYWRRGIWVRVVVDVVAKGGNGVPVREAGGSINVALLSVKGKVIKKACEKCSKYYFRYKNIESSGQAPAFEIEERERCTAVRGGRASFNMRVWECSHHYLSPHTLLFSWVDPCNPCMRTAALCPKEIVISSGSGQEKKLKEMTVSREEVFRDFVEALILMENAQYCRAVEALRCIRWKCFHFLGIGLPSIVDEKIGDCFLRMGDYKGAIEHFARAVGQLVRTKERIEPALFCYMRALLYLKLSNASYSRERDSVQVMNLKKSAKTLKKARIAFEQGLELDCACKEGGEKEESEAPKDSMLVNFVKKYLQYSYYQDMTGLLLKMKPFQLAMGDLAGLITYEVIEQTVAEAEKCLAGLQKDDKIWFSTDMLAIFGPLVEKLHTGVDSLKKLLHSPFATNNVITRFSLMLQPLDPEEQGEKILCVLKELKLAAEEAEELHPKGHRTICICKCLLTFFMYLAGQLAREEALRAVEEILRVIEKFWKANGGTAGGRFECQQVASIAEFIRTNQRNLANPFAVFDDREHMQLYRLWIHSPLDIAVWALQSGVSWG